MSNYQNIDKYRKAHGLNPLTDEQLMKLAMKSINETIKQDKKWQDKNNDRDRISHTDRFGNIHLYD